MEVTINSSVGENGRVFFPQVEALRGKPITGIEAFSNTELTTTPDGSIVISTIDIVTVTLVEGSFEKHFKAPYYSWMPSQNSGIWKEFVPFIPDWQKCYLQFVEPLTVEVDTPQAALFQVHYNE